jgi:hypothetical protein
MKYETYWYRYPTVAPHGDGFSFERPRTAGQIALGLDCVCQLFQICCFDMLSCTSLLGGPLISLPTAASYLKTVRRIFTYMKKIYTTAYVQRVTQTAIMGDIQSSV